MEITKRDGRKVEFDVTKIQIAITKAFKEVMGRQMLLIKILTRFYVVCTLRLKK